MTLSLFRKFSSDFRRSGGQGLVMKGFQRLGKLPQGKILAHPIARHVRLP
jgi:hypothetical protein